jgi:hypothetical protein
MCCDFQRSSQVLLHYLAGENSNLLLVGYTPRHMSSGVMAPH